MAFTSLFNRIIPMDGRSPLRTIPLAGLLDIRVTGRPLDAAPVALPVAPQPDRVFAVTDAPARVPGLTSLPGSQQILASGHRVIGSAKQVGPIKASSARYDGATKTWQHRLTADSLRASTLNPLFQAAMEYRTLIEATEDHLETGA
jgi:hypothetical protein